MLAQEYVAETGHRYVMRDFKTMTKKGLGTADRDDIVDGLHRGGIRGFAEHLRGRLGALFNRAARLKDEFIVRVHADFAQGATVSFEALLRPRRHCRSCEERNALVSQLEQVLRRGVACQEVVALHIDELAAKRGGVAEQHGGNSTGQQLLVDTRFRRHAVNRDDEQPIHTPRYEPPDAGFLALRHIGGEGQQHIVAHRMSSFLDGRDHAVINGVGHRRKHEPE